MDTLILVFGVVIALVGLIGAVLPARFRQLLGSWQGDTRFLFAVIVRIVLGAVLLAAAPDLLFPRLLEVLGGVSILAAIGLLLMGQARLDRMIAWWLRRSDAVLRVSTILAALFGLFLAYVTI
jgi:hypothetical protein